MVDSLVAAAWPGCATTRSTVETGPSDGEPAGEPGDGQLGHLFQGPWLLEQVTGARDDLQARLAAEPVQGGPVELQHLGVESADDQQGGRQHASQGGPGQEGGAGAGAGTEQANGQTGGPLLCGQPVGGGPQPPGQQLNVEAESAAGAVGGFLFEGEQVEQEGGQAGPAERGGDLPVAGAVAAAAAAVGE